TCFWLDDGRFFGWEGCFDQTGCCSGTCTHVWSYAQTLAYLFPGLEREMRRIEFVIETEDDGYMSFRACRVFGETHTWPWGDHRADAAADGQMGSLIRACREWRLSGDRGWLEQVWPGVKRALSFAQSEWDPDGDGLTDGSQHNTYDINFFGPNPLAGIYYLAGLRAVEELAGVMGEPELAAHCRQTFDRGSAQLDALLWNGEYYIQKLDDVNAHKYQFGLGCLSDQLLGQLHARLVGLGDLLPAAHVRTGIKSVFDHNFKRDFSEHVNCQRTYVLNDEAGLVLCSWPAGGRPRLPFVYSDEVWTGIEYQVAAHLIYEGWVDEGLEIVRAVRDRHDGIRRNPWNEVECGHHYARSLASWAVLVALSGFQCDLGRGVISFAPRLEASTEAGQFNTFWSCGRGWGTYSQQRDSAGAWRPRVEVLGGDMSGIRVEACGEAWTL
ncbi:MAG: GH116 family glycosyl hydrolase, partial [Anaerolineales bacterium]